MKQRTFRVTNTSQELLACVEMLPQSKGNQPFPVVILCHGFAYYKEEDGLFTALAQRLAEAGYACYYFDFSGCGESQGNYEQTTLTKLVADLKAVWAEVSEYQYIDNTQLSLVGQSFGTNVVVASGLASVQRMVLCGSFPDPFALLSSHMDIFNEFDVSVKHRSDARDTTIGPDFWADLKKFDLKKDIANYDCPILFVHGEDDGTVPIAEGRALMAAVRRPELFVAPQSGMT